MDGVKLCIQQAGRLWKNNQGKSIDYWIATTLLKDKNNCRGRASKMSHKHPLFTIGQNSWEKQLCSRAPLESSPVLKLQSNWMHPCHVSAGALRRVAWYTGEICSSKHGTWWWVAQSTLLAGMLKALAALCPFLLDSVCIFPELTFCSFHSRMHFLTRIFPLSPPYWHHSPPLILLCLTSPLALSPLSVRVVVQNLDNCLT